jgi:hypothetical protein
MADGWKALVTARHPKAFVASEGIGETKRFVVRTKVDGDTLSISTMSTPDAWRCAWLNIDGKRPPDEGPGTTLLL